MNTRTVEDEKSTIYDDDDGDDIMEWCSSPALTVETVTKRSCQPLKKLKLKPYNLYPATLSWVLRHESEGGL